MRRNKPRMITIRQVRSNKPRMMTIRQVAATGILPETALRTLSKENKLPAIQVGVVTYINYDKLCVMLNDLGNAC